MAEKEYPSDELVVLRATCEVLQRQVGSMTAKLRKVRECIVIQEPWDRLQELYASGIDPVVTITLDYDKVAMFLEDRYQDCFEFPAKFDREGKAE